MTRMTLDDAFRHANARHHAGQLAVAEEIYRQILTHDPNHALAIHYLALIAFQTGHLDDSIPLFEKAIRLRGDLADFHQNFGVALHAASRLDDALACFQSALAINPRSTAALLGIGGVHNDRKQHADAIDAFRNAARIDPDEPLAVSDLGATELLLGRFTAAHQTLAAAVQRFPDFAAAHANFAVCLLDEARPDEALAECRRAALLEADNPILASNLLLTMHYHPALSPQEIFDAHQAWGQKFGLTPAPPAPMIDRSNLRKLRIGFVSADLRDHSIAFFLAPLLRHLDREAFEIVAYPLVQADDPHARRLRALCDQWRPLPREPDARSADRIRNDRIDILIDLAGHTASNRLPLFAHRPAPIQATWLGYPDTTGLPAIDFRITDALADPPGLTDAFNTERLLRLPACAWCYELSENLPPVAPLPALAAGFVTFGSFNNFAKVSSLAIALWSRLLAAVPGAHLLLKSTGLDDPDFALDVKQRFAAAGVDPDRLDLLGRAVTFDDHMNCYARVDIALDTFPYHGVTTTCEALAMGVPVVTLAGQTHVSRVGISLLTNANCSDWIAHDLDQYIAIAQSLAADPQPLAALRSALRDRTARSPLCDAKHFARDFESIMKKIGSPTP